MLLVASLKLVARLLFIPAPNAPGGPAISMNFPAVNSAVLSHQFRRPHGAAESSRSRPSISPSYSGWSNTSPGRSSGDGEACFGCCALVVAAVDIETLLMFLKVPGKSGGPRASPL